MLIDADYDFVLDGHEVAFMKEAIVQYCTNAGFENHGERKVAISLERKLQPVYERIVRELVEKE